MLDFSFIEDALPTHSRTTSYAGGIEYEEFVRAQELKLIEPYLDFYGKFRWSSLQVKQKRAVLTPTVTAAIPKLASILKQACAANCGLTAFGD